MRYAIHPEVLEAVTAEYKRLHRSNPTTSVAAKMRFAKQYVRAVALADTLLFFKGMEVGPHETI